MDISDTLAPNSDQLDAVDLLGGDQTFTIADVTRNNGDQPINIVLAEFPRPWRPGKSMRRVLAACWGTNAKDYIGRRVTLYCDPDVVFGKEKVGGTRIRALSHIDKPKQVPLLVARGRSSMYTVQPLKVPTPSATPSTTRSTTPPATQVTPEAVANSTDINQLREWQQAEPRAHDAIEARIRQLAADAAVGEQA